MNSLNQLVSTKLWRQKIKEYLITVQFQFQNIYYSKVHKDTLKEYYLMGQPAQLYLEIMI